MMLARVLNGWPLRGQIIVTVGVTILIVALGAAEFIRQLETRAFERNFEEQSRKLVAMLAATSLDAIISEDRPVLSTMLSQLATVDPQVERVNVFNEDELPLSSWNREAGSWKAPLAQRIQLSQNVSLADENFGRIEVTWNVTEQHAFIRDEIVTVYSYALGIALLLGLLLLLVFEAIVVKPIQAINDYTIRLHEGRSEGPLRLAGARELTGLTSAVNELGGMLDLRAGMALAMRTPPHALGIGEGEAVFVDARVLNLEELVDDVVAELAEQAHDKGLELIAHLADDAPSQVIGDRERIYTVLLNLVSNAVRFTIAGDVRIHVERMGKTEAGGTLRFSVIDTGTGFDARLHDSVFDPLEHPARETPEDAGACDPGLSICRQLIEGMGGLIGVDSQPGHGPGHGSVFWFELLLPEANETCARGPEPALAGCRILLVESHLHMREHLLAVLRSQDMLVDCEASAEAGLECLRGACNAERLHEIVLFDSALPDMNGDVFTRCIEADPVFDSVRLVRMERHAMNVGPANPHPDSRLAGIIHRPVRQRELIRLLCSALGESGAGLRAGDASNDDGTVAKVA